MATSILGVWIMTSVEKLTLSLRVTSGCLPSTLGLSSRDTVTAQRLVHSAVSPCLHPKGDSNPLYAWHVYGAHETFVEDSHGYPKV